MNNQNNNGLGENNVGLGANGTPNPNPVNNETPSSVVKNVTDEETGAVVGNIDNSITPTPMEPVNLNDTIEPVKPTLDSILNGSTEIKSMPESPSIAPVAPSIDTLESTEVTAPPINEVPSMPTSAPTVEAINNVATPTPIETLPNDTVVDKSAETVVTPVLEQPTEVQNTVPLETTVIKTPEAPRVEEQPKEQVVETPIVNEGPVIETIEENTVQPNTANNTQTTETLEEITSVPTTDQSMPPIDDFNEVPVPPTLDGDGKNNKKKDNKKTLIIVFIVLLVIAIGFGVYYFLVIAKKSSEKVINPKEVKVELGTVLSDNIDDYATILGYNKNNCSLNLDNVNSQKVSTYKYTITCEKANVEGLVIVDDTTKPEVTVNDLTVALNTTLNVEDFIEECKDASKCSYTFQTDVENLTKNIGEYDVEILVSDEYNNQNKVTAKLTVARTAPARYLTCKKAEETLEEIGATFIDAYKIGIDANDNFYSAVRTSEFTFNNLNDYNQTVNDYKNTNTIYNRTGSATFNEEKMSIALKENKTLDDMNKDLNGKLPNNFNILRAYLSGLGYICN